MLNTFVRVNPLAVFCAAGVLLALVLAGCQRQEITTYEIPKESTPGHSHTAPGGAPAVGATDPHAGVATAMPRIKVARLPEGWVENPNPGSMRAASFKVDGGGGNVAEVAVIPMGGMAGIELQLVNMWREQVKLPPLADADQASQSAEVSIAGGTGKLFELASQDAVLDGNLKARILVAMLKRENTTWFFKFAGEDQLVAANRQKFVDFLKSVTFEAPALPPGHPPMGGGMAMGQGMMGAGGDSIPPSSGAQPKWEVPASWTEVAHSPFLVAKFQATGAEGVKADINVSSSKGDGGGLLPNVNRWRGQLSLGAMDQAALDKVAASLDLATGKAVMVDFSGEGAENSDPVRCIAIMVPREGETWFYKLMGGADLVAREKEALLKFVRSVKY